MPSREFFVIAGFNVAWLAAALSAAAGAPLWGVLACFGFAAAAIGTGPRGLFHLISASTALGLMAESGLLVLRITSVSSPGPVPWLAPLWLVGLWTAFGAVLPPFVARFGTSLKLAAVLGAVAGPLSYLAGSRLGAMALTEPLWTSLAAIAAMWAVAMPILVLLSRALTGTSDQLRRS